MFCQVTRNTIDLLEQSFAVVLEEETHCREQSRSQSSDSIATTYMLLEVGQQLLAHPVKGTLLLDLLNQFIWRYLSSLRRHDDITYVGRVGSIQRTRMSVMYWWWSTLRHEQAALI